MYKFCTTACCCKETCVSFLCLASRGFPFVCILYVRLVLVLCLAVCLVARGSTLVSCLPYVSYFVSPWPILRLVLCHSSSPTSRVLPCVSRVSRLAVCIELCLVLPCYRIVSRLVLCVVSCLGSSCVSNLSRLGCRVFRLVCRLVYCVVSRLASSCVSPSVSLIYRIVSRIFSSCSLPCESSRVPYRVSYHGMYLSCVLHCFSARVLEWPFPCHRRVK